MCWEPAPLPWFSLSPGWTRPPSATGVGAAKGAGETPPDCNTLRIPPSRVPPHRDRWRKINFRAFDSHQGSGQSPRSLVRPMGLYLPIQLPSGYGDGHSTGGLGLRGSLAAPDPGFLPDAVGDVPPPWLGAGSQPRVGTGEQQLDGEEAIHWPSNALPDAATEQKARATCGDSSARSNGRTDLKNTLEKRVSSSCLLRGGTGPCDRLASRPPHHISPRQHRNEGKKDGKRDESPKQTCCSTGQFDCRNGNIPNLHPWASPADGQREPQGKGKHKPQI